QAKAAEREKQAAEKQKRIEDEKVLAAEKANAAAQAKASEKANEKAREKAEEDASKAAEKKKADDAKLAAEQAKEQAKEAKEQAKEQVKAAEDAKKAEQAKKPVEQTVAALTPPDARSGQPAAPLDIPRLLQTELKRVGCKTGEIDSEWNASSRKALSLFNDKAGTKLDVKLASIDALDTVKSKTGRVCPLECERGTRASG